MRRSILIPCFLVALCAPSLAFAANYDEAAKWYDRASQAGVVPAMFRLGTLYEKGLSVKKDLDVARRYYVLAAERGNAKAMHNLAVLDADGGSKGANYKSASQWFRKAADRGVADSQFNLGILYARGIGVEQNLAESFKWFSLAAARLNYRLAVSPRRWIRRMRETLTSPRRSQLSSEQALVLHEFELCLRREQPGVVLISTYLMYHDLCAALCAAAARAGARRDPGLGRHRGTAGRGRLRRLRGRRG